MKQRGGVFENGAERKYEQNQQALNRMLSMQSLSSSSSAKYQLKYRELKATYNNLLTVSQTLEGEYKTLIANISYQHKQEMKELKKQHEIEIVKLQSSIRVLEVRMENREEERRKEEEREEVEMRKRGMLAQEEKELLLGEIERLKRENYIIHVEKERMYSDNSQEIAGIQSLLNNVDTLAKQLEQAKAALDTQVLRSQVLAKELEETKSQINQKHMENYTLLKDHQLKNQTIQDMERIIDHTQHQRNRQGMNRTHTALWKKQLGLGSPKKGRIVMEIQQMIETYKRNLRNS